MLSGKNDPSNLLFFKYARYHVFSDLRRGFEIDCHLPSNARKFLVKFVRTDLGVFHF